MDEISVNAFGLSTMCRLCLSRGVATLDIFTFSSILMDQVVEVIMKCAPVQITRCDEMPKFICQSCHNQLEKSHQFRMQIIKSEKTLRRYLHQLRIANKEIKAEWPIQGHSGDPLILNTNTNIIMKCESSEFQDGFDMNVDLKEEVPTNYTSAYKINEDMSLKSEIKEPPIDDCSLMPTEYTANFRDTSSRGDDSIEIGYKKSENEEPAENLTGLHFASVIKHFAKREDKNKNTSANHKKHRKINKINHTCDVCNKSFSDVYNFRIHQRIHFGEKPYECNICKRDFTSLGNLKAHKRVHTGEKPFKCDDCNKCFRNSNTLTVHQRKHNGEKPYECNVCNKGFTSLGYLKTHKRLHTGEKPYQCDVCGKRFIVPSALCVHKRIHTGVKSHQCDVCGKCFIKSGQLKRHMFVHTGVKMFQCGVCDKSFNDSDHLKRHERIHTGEKPYQCYECERRFSLNQHLKTHLKGVHKKSMIYKCTACDEKFKMKYDLNLHIKDVHNVPK